MKRFFFLVPDLSETKEIVHELEEIGINETNVHVLGNASEKLEKEHLQEANLLQTSDLVPSLIRGGFIGIGFSVILAALYAYALPANIPANFLVIALILFFGMLFGAWVSSLIGVSVENPVVEKFKGYIKNGHYIMMVDSPTEKENELMFRVINHHHRVRLATS